MLSGSKIKACMSAGSIKIVPFDEKYLGPNSYDVHLGGTGVLELVDSVDIDHPQEAKYREIPWGRHDAIMLEPGRLYLAVTEESTTSNFFIPCLDGCSSNARLGIQIHMTAGFGDFGWGFDAKLENPTNPKWTLEIVVTNKTVIRKGSRIGQVYFEEMNGGREIRYGSRGRYNSQQGPQPPLRKIEN